MLGREARENGLKDSLLERLQQLYKELGDRALKHMVSLNTNYRCHPDIIKISRQLFYRSKIISHPQNASVHPLAKHPLVFICSSLTVQAKSKLEARLLLGEVRKYTSSWPACWGKKDGDKNICIVTASRTQVLML